MERLAVDRRKRLLAVAGGVCALSIIVSRKKNREKWEKEWIKRREESSHVGLIKELREEELDFKNYLRLNQHQFEELLRILGPQLQKKNTVMRESISPEHRLAATLRYLATGQDYEQLKYTTRIAAQTLGRIIPETCQLIFETMKGEYMKVPQSKEEWKEQADKFKKKWQIINCGGCIDGKHIRIVKPANSGALYYNYKKFYSIVLMAVVNADYEVIYADVGKQGRLSDGGVIETTTFYDSLINEKLNLPGNNENDENLNFVFLADEAFGLHEHILKPYAQRTLNYERRIYNYRLARGRNTVENSFGLMASRFRILHHTIGIAPEKAIFVVLSICILHNYLMRSSSAYAQAADKFHPDTHELQPGSWRNVISGNELVSVLPPVVPRFPTLCATNNREAYLQFFNSKGKVPWQDEMITKGKA